MNVLGERRGREHGRRQQGRLVHQPLVLVAVFALLTVGIVVVGGRVEAQAVVHVRAAEVSRALDGTEVVELPFAARHVAVHWAGNPDAGVTVSFARQGSAFDPPVDAGRDEIGEQRGNGESYGALLAADGATVVRVTSDRPLVRVSVLALADGDREVTYSPVPGRPAGGSVEQPSISPRSAWGADESLRFQRRGKTVTEVWPTVFHPVQKLIVHHTAGRNADPDPAATIRSMYYYHAVTQGWGDIGYNFLIDESGKVYKGRHSHTTSTPSSASPSPDDTLTGVDSAGRGVTAAHAYGFNSGTVGIALLGTFTTQQPTDAARNALVDTLAWKADAHGLDPEGSSLYINPTNGAQQTFANVAGHVDVNVTECPGDLFYPTLPAIRAATAERISSSASVTTTVVPTSTSTTVAVATTTTTAPKGRKPAR